MTWRSAGRALRPVAGAAILATLLLHFGAEPFLDGLRAVDAPALLVALGVTAVTTWCCARRWSLLAERLDVPVPVGTAYAACHRAQLLNAVLPGGVAGDVHRGFRHGRDAGALGRGLRSVVWDRAAGQVVLGALALVGVLWLAAPLQRAALWTVLVVAGAAAVGYAVLPHRLLRALVAEVRRVPGAAQVWPRVLALSVVAAAGHVGVYVVAARTAGVDAPLATLVPLALVVLVAAAIPLNVAGWGPREGAAAWVFATAGLGGGTGIEVSVVYGVMALVATAPGALVLVADVGWFRGWSTRVSLRQAQDTATSSTTVGATTGASTSSTTVGATTGASTSSTTGGSTTRPREAVDG